MDFLLSICIPTFNRAKIVSECVSNCLHQCPEYVEICVTDNCSEDNTKELLSDIHDIRFSYHRNESNIGYINLSKCMKNGRGKFCLLLSDEDDLFDADWELLRTRLEEDTQTNVFQFEYYDLDGKQLLSGPEKPLHRDTFETYQFAKNKFGYAGGSIIRHDAIVKVWDSIDKTTLLWRLYSETIVPMKCSAYGSIDKMPYIKAKRSERDNTGISDTNAWGGDKNEPYWSVYSRREQFICWFDYINALDTGEECKQRLLYQNRSEALVSVYTYYCMIHDAERLKSHLFKKRIDVINRDRQTGILKWLGMLLSTCFIMNKKLKYAMKGKKKKWNQSFRYNAEYFKYLIAFIIKICRFFLMGPAFFTDSDTYS